MPMPSRDDFVELMVSSARILAVTNDLMPAALMVAVAKVLATMPRRDALQECQMTAKKVLVLHTIA